MISNKETGVRLRLQFLELVCFGSGLVTFPKTVEPNIVSGFIS